MTITITITDSLANDIVASFGRSIAMTKSEGLAKADRLRVGEFIATLKPNMQDSCRWLLEETVKIWSEPR